MKKENMKQWLKAAGVRAIKTVAQTAVATIGSAAALAGVLSLLTSVAGLPELADEGGSNYADK